MDWLTEPWGLQNLEWAAVPLRIALGVIFIDAGLGKWRRGIRGTGDWFQSLGFPQPHLLAMGVASLELVGGALLLLGLGVAWVAIPLAGNMLVATWGAEDEAQRALPGRRGAGLRVGRAAAAGLRVADLHGRGSGLARQRDQLSPDQPSPHQLSRTHSPGRPPF